MIGFLLRALISAAGFWLATQWVPGIHIDSSNAAGTLLIAGLVMGVVNAIVKPIAFVLTLPFTIVTLGLFLFVLNAAMVALVAWLVPGLHIADFKAALLTAITVWVVSWVGYALIGNKVRGS